MNFLKIKGNVAFVASTLPAAFLSKHIREYNIKTIIVANSFLLYPYSWIQKIFTEVQIISCPRNKILSLFSLSILILLVKIRREKIIFFHECCWPVLDALLYLIRPFGYFIPIVTMNGFRKLTDEETCLLSKNRNNALFRKNGKISLKKIFLMIIVRRLFFIYESSSDNDQRAKYFVFSLKRYGNYIKQVRYDHGDFKYSDSKEDSASLNKLTECKTLLIVCASEPVSNLSQIAVYKEICLKAKELGYKIYIKDHPNPNSRLNLNFEDAKILPPDLPVELIHMYVNDKIGKVIGVASTSLLYFDDIAISILKLLPFEIADAELRMNHLKSLEGGNRIKFVENLKELFRLL